MNAKPQSKVTRLRPGAVSGPDLEFWVVGISHHTAPVALRERMAFSADGLAPAARRLVASSPGLVEAVVLSTCNRVEVFAMVRPDVDPVGPVVEFLGREHSVPPALLDQHRYAHRGRAALRHLFRVASSLDSMMVGEPQILGQLKEQYRFALDDGIASTRIQPCFERAFRVAKRVRTETGIASKAVSVSSAAVDLAQRIFDDLRDKTAMIVGAGKMSVLAARHLQAHGIASVIVTNRSFDRAVEMAREFGGTPVPFERYTQYLHLADVVLGSVATSGPILGPTQMAEVMRARRRKPMFLIDLGVPRNFDPAINDLDNVYLYNIDDLSRVADEHRAEREREAIRAEEIVEDEVERFWRSLSVRDVTPTIVALRGRLDEIRRAELERALSALQRLEPGERRALEAMTTAIVNKILHAPTAMLKALANESDAESAAEIAAMVHRLFALEPQDAGSDDPPARPDGDDRGE
ncbi:glutamyl-tRNA reductase [bacterium]|nr:glutamyl-tRNA reductase [bacterium]